ncbi:MAG: DUF4421 family protein [Prevotella sp.]|nr:DUF4421 family protein [Prevotella sp.]
MGRKIIPILTMLLLLAAKGEAQSRREMVRAHMDSLLQKRYSRTSYDTAYITRPEFRLTMKARANVSGNSIHTRGTVNGIHSEAHLKTEKKMTLSVGANYQGLSLGLSLNPASLTGKKKTDYEVNLNIYSTRLSLDASYQNSKTLSGDIEQQNFFHIVQGQMEMKVLNIAAYYTFNHRRFSYPAAFTQSYIQRRSAGSWLAGLSFQGGSIKKSKEAPEAIPDMRIKADHLGLGAGYGYNLVLSGKWLLHFSALPTIVVYNHNNLTVNGERREASPFRLNMIFNERLAVVHNFSPQWFAGVTAVMNNSIFHNDDVVINQNKWMFRALVGMRLWKMRK